MLNTRSEKKDEFRPFFRRMKVEAEIYLNNFSLGKSLRRRDLNQGLEAIDDGRDFYMEKMFAKFVMLYVWCSYPWALNAIVHQRSIQLILNRSKFIHKIFLFYIQNIFQYPFKLTPFSIFVWERGHWGQKVLDDLQKFLIFLIHRTLLSLIKLICAQLLISRSLRKWHSQQWSRLASEATKIRWIWINWPQPDHSTSAHPESTCPVRFYLPFRNLCVLLT